VLKAMVISDMDFDIAAHECAMLNAKVQPYVALM
jgi:hypothetical protein